MITPSSNNLKKVQVQSELITSGFSATEMFFIQNLKIALISSFTLAKKGLHVQKCLRHTQIVQRERQNISAKSYLPQMMCPQQLKVMCSLPDCVSYAPSHCQQFELNFQICEQSEGRRKRKLYNRRNCVSQHKMPRCQR